MMQHDQSSNIEIRIKKKKVNVLILYLYIINCTSVYYIIIPNERETNNYLLYNTHRSSAKRRDAVVVAS